MGFLNFVAFLVESALFGGMALSGHVSNGHYFLGGRGGELTEVSQLVWAVSYLHGLVTFVFAPLMFLSMALLILRFVLPQFMTGTAVSGASERVTFVRGSGALLWKGLPGGVVGSVNFTALMLGAEIYESGIVVTPTFMKASAVLAREIRAVRFGRRIFSPMIEIEHAGIDIPSPLILYGRRKGGQGRAITFLTSSRTG